jgi:hypothetical protein
VFLEAHGEAEGNDGANGDEHKEDDEAALRAQTRAVGRIAALPECPVRCAMADVAVAVVFVAAR